MTTHYTLGDAFVSPPGTAREADITAPRSVVVQYSERDAEALTLAAEVRGLTLEQLVYESSMASLVDDQTRSQRVS